MPDYVKSLIVIIAAGITVFVVGRLPAIQQGISDKDYRRRASLWFAVTTIAFLSHNFWIYVILSSIVLYFGAKRDSDPFAVYLVTIFAMPSNFQLLIPGIGPINHFFLIDHSTILALVILLPTALRLRRNRGQRPPSHSRLPDTLIGMYILLSTFVVMGGWSSVTELLRSAFYQVIGIWLPYYVASRSFTTLTELRKILLVFLISVSIVAALAVFESARGWMMYVALAHTMDSFHQSPIEYFRRESGVLRAQVTAGHAIALGYLMMIGIGTFLFLAPEIRSRWRRLITGVFLVGGLIAAFSRGPWVGAAVMVSTYAALSPSFGQKVKWLLFGGSLCAALLFLTPLGSTIVEYLPFVGSEATESVDYRFELLEVSIEVFFQHPILGDVNYIQNPLMEQMRQGQGIIDMVNTYLQVVLLQGVIGLSIFLMIFFAPTVSILKIRSRNNLDEQSERLSRSLLAILAGILVTIGTVSSVQIIPLLYWLVLGFCVGYIRMHNLDRRTKSNRSTTASPGLKSKSSMT